MTEKELILEEFAKQLEYWVNESTDAASNINADLTWSENPESFHKLQELIGDGLLKTSTLKKILEEILRGYTVSLFTVIDGGTALAEKVKLELKGASGEQVGELHDDFVMHLVNTGRLE